MASASLTSVRTAADRVAAVSWGGRRRARGERRLVLEAHGPRWRQRPVDDVAADVAVGAGARVEQDGVPVAVHGEQARTGQLMGHGDGALVRGGRVVDVPDDQ